MPPLQTREHERHDLTATLRKKKEKKVESKDITFPPTGIGLTPATRNCNDYPAT